VQPSVQSAAELGRDQRVVFARGAALGVADQGVAAAHVDEVSRRDFAGVRALLVGAEVLGPELRDPAQGLGEGRQRGKRRAHHQPQGGRGAHAPREGAGEVAGLAEGLVALPVGDEQSPGEGRVGVLDQSAALAQQVAREGRQPGSDGHDHIGGRLQVLGRDQRTLHPCTAF